MLFYLFTLLCAADTQENPPAGHDVPNRRNFFHGAAVIVLFVTDTPQASRTADTGSADAKQPVFSLLCL